tara:strand:- start:528 stop:3374 length:2847 start_codon:yes stop_codon:yes gene_type:complete
MGVVFTNNAETTLAAAITSTSATSISVTSSSTFPTVGAGEYFYATIDDGSNNEIVKITAVSGTTWTVVRAQDNTTARTFANGSTVQLRTTAALLTDIQENIASKSANQTVYNATAASSATAYDIGINPGVEANAMVFLDGVMQHHDTFSFSGSTLTFDAAPVNGTKIEVIVDNLINLQSSNLTVDTFTATSNQTAFTLSDSPAAESNLLVFIDGVFQNQAAYTISSNTLTLDTGVVSGRTVTVYVINPVNIGTPSDGTITSAKLSGNITMPGTLTVGSHDVAFDSPTFVVDNANSRVGLGTASPTVPVDIVGEVKTSSHINIGGNLVKASGDLTVDVAGGINLDSDGGEISFKDAGTEIGKFNNSSSDFVMEAGVQDKDILFKGNDGGSGITALTLDMSDAGSAYFNNKVGIGETSPENILHIKKAASGSSYSADGGDLVIIENNSSAGIDFRTPTGDAGAIYFSDTTRARGAVIYYHSLDHMYFNVAGTSGAMVLDNSGNVSIGNTSVAFPSGGGLQVYNASNPRIKLANSTTGVGSGDGTQIYMDSSDVIYDQKDSGNQRFFTGGSERVRITSSGNVGIGTTSPSQKLHVNGEIKATSADITDSAGNTSIGYGALNNLTSGDSNVAVGYEALEDVTDGIHNTGIGYRAGMNITTGDYNVAVGNYALSTNTSGGWNTCVGYGAGNSMSGNDHNTCIGRNAGYNITSGGSNTIVGSQAGDAITSAHNNTFIGTRAGTSATTGNGYNTAIGVDALEDCTTGSFNVSLGTNTIKNVTTGANNIGIGYRAGNAGQPGGQITSQSNIACIGDTAITSLNCQVSLSVASDERDKTDFTALDLGLDFVKSLKPYTFKWDKRSSYVDWDKNPDTDLLTVTHDGTHKEAQLDIGFKAQDVEKLEKSAGYNRTNKTNLTYALSPDGKTYSMKYEKLVPVLVKAIQELEAKVAELESK